MQDLLQTTASKHSISEPYDPRSVPHWSHEDKQLAAKEGWVLSFQDHRIYSLAIHGSAVDVIAYVRLMADQASPLHLKALKFLTLWKILDVSSQGRTPRP